VASGPATSHVIYGLTERQSNMVSTKVKRLVVVMGAAVLMAVGMLATEARAGLPTCQGQECTSASVCYSPGKCLDHQVCSGGSWQGSC
jgi:hypothetical protein